MHMTANIKRGLASGAVKIDLIKKLVYALGPRIVPPGASRAERSRAAAERDHHHMKVLISGVCGFAGSHLARFLLDSHQGIEVLGLDNLARQGSETNRLALQRLGVRLFHGDLRMASDVDSLPRVDWVIDAAAQPSVLAGRDGKTSPRQLLEHNLLGTINLLEYCRNSSAGIILLSTSRVYSIPALAQLPLLVESSKFVLDPKQAGSPAVSAAGVTELFSTEAPISLYGASKLASEQLAQEYAAAFGLPVWINRCGVLGERANRHPRTGHLFLLAARSLYAASA